MGSVSPAGSVGSQACRPQDDARPITCSFLLPRNKYDTPNLVHRSTKTGRILRTVDSDQEEINTVKDYFELLILKMPYLCKYGIFYILTVFRRHICLRIES